ncbi:MAG: A/G-specific adenine glycosylase [Candidatus Limnocylindrales bacterium]
MDLPEAEVTARLHEAALGWFDRAGRRFAFRGTRDPYAVLVSEVILQQTQVSRGEPAWRAFMERFPTFDALAMASPAEVLRAWAGLGYNRRALALHRTAVAVVERHGGVMPSGTEELRALPGVGPYTARAIQAIAFGRAVGAIDTNVRRVLGRVIAGHGSRWDAGKELPLRKLQAAADALVVEDRPADWTAALMDIGSSFCRPRRPDCAACPLAGECRYALAGSAEVSRPQPRVPRAAARESPAAYESTTRWLRGRIVERLRALPDGKWTRFEAPIGTHDARAVEAALVQLELEGLVERDAKGRVRLPH